MFKRSHLSALLAGATLAATLGSPTAQAASGAVDVDITFPPLVILYYYPNIDVTVDPDDLEDVIAAGNAHLDVAECTEGSSGSVAELSCETTEDALTLTTGTVNSGVLEYDADIANDTRVSTAVDDDISITLLNSWAVRALATSLTASVVGGGGDFSSPTISPTSPTPSMTLGAGNVGDLSFDVDLGGLTGVTASDTLTITVVSP